MKLRPYLLFVKRWFDIVPHTVMVGLGLDNCQPPRPIGLGLQQHNGAFSGSHNSVDNVVQGLSAVEKPNRDLCHQLQDVGQAGLITVNKCAEWTSGRRKWSSSSQLWMGNLEIYIHLWQSCCLFCCLLSRRETFHRMFHLTSHDSRLPGVSPDTCLALACGSPLTGIQTYLPIYIIVLAFSACLENCRWLLSVLPPSTHLLVHLWLDYNTCFPHLISTSPTNPTLLMRPSQ